MLMSLIIQLSGGCGNTSEMNPPPPTFICSASFSCWPAAFHDISNIMSETVVRVIPERLVRQELKVTGSEDKPPDPGNVSCMFCPFRATLREPTTAHTSTWAPAKNLSSLPLPHVMTWHPDWMGVMLVDTSKDRCRCGSSGSFLLSFMVVMWYTSKREPALFASSLPPGNKDQWNCKLDAVMNLCRPVSSRIELYDPEMSRDDATLSMFLYEKPHAVTFSYK